MAQADDDASFRAAIAEARSETGPGISHAQVIAETEELLKNLPTLEEARAAVFSPVDDAEVSDEEFEKEWAQGLTAEEFNAESERFLDALEARSRSRNAQSK